MNRTGGLGTPTRLQTSWLVALVVTVAFAAGFFVVIRDVGVTDAVFANGVVQAQRFVSTGGQANTAAGNLPGALSAVDASAPPVSSLIVSLGAANAAASSFASSAGQLGAILASAGSPLSGVLSSVNTVNQQTTKVGSSVASIISSLVTTAQEIRALSAALDVTLARAQAIQSKLQLLRVTAGQ